MAAANDNNPELEKIRQHALKMLRRLRERQKEEEQKAR
jgi:hypothetical protein